MNLKSEIYALSLTFLLTSCSSSLIQQKETARDPAGLDFNCFDFIKKIRSNDQKVKTIEVSERFNQLFNAKNLDPEEYRLYSELLNQNKELIDSPRKAEHLLAVVDYINKTSPTPIDLQTQKKIYSLIKSFNFDSYTRANELKSFATKLTILLKGLPERKFVQNNRLENLLSYSIAFYGLQGLIQRFPQKEQFHFLKKANAFSKIIINDRNSNLLGNSLLIFMGGVTPNLLKVNHQLIPDELFQKIFLEGIEKHKDEIEKYLVRSKIRYNYNRFVEIYNPIIYLYASYFIYEIIKENDVTFSNVDEKIKESYEKAKSHLTKIILSSIIENLTSKNEDSKNIEDFVNASSEEKIEILVQEASELNKLETGKELSEEEKEEMRKIFTSELNSSN